MWLSLLLRLVAIRCLGHTIPGEEFIKIADALGHSEARIVTLLQDLHSYTDAVVIWGMVNSTGGREARFRIAAGTSCLAFASGLRELLNHVDLGVPSASHMFAHDSI